MTTYDQSEPPVSHVHNGFEVYPMPVFAAMETSDVDALAQWYHDALGFGIMFKMPGPGGQPTLVHLRRRKYQDVLILPIQPGSDIPEVGRGLVTLLACWRGHRSACGARRRAAGHRKDSR